MKRSTTLIILFVTLLICIGGFLIFHQHQTFSLSPEFYGQSELRDISADELQELISEQKTFVLLAHQPNCQASAELSNIVRQFSEQNSVTIYRIAFSDLKNSALVDGLRFYPTFVIYHNGEVVDFLEADSAEDVSAYTSLGGFTEWFKGYVRL